MIKATVSWTHDDGWENSCRVKTADDPEVEEPMVHVLSYILRCYEPARTEVLLADLVDALLDGKDPFPGTEDCVDRFRKAGLDIARFWNEHDMKAREGEEL